MQELISTPVTTWPRRAEAGLRGIHLLHTACQRAGLSTGSCSSDVQRLHAVFDVLVAHGLGSLILDYIQLVCSNIHFTSRYSAVPRPCDQADMLCMCSQKHLHAHVACWPASRRSAIEASPCTATRWSPACWTARACRGGAMQRCTGQQQKLRAHAVLRCPAALSSTLTSCPS